MHANTIDGIPIASPLIRPALPSEVSPFELVLRLVLVLVLELVLVLVLEAEPVLAEMGVFCVSDVGAEAGPGVIVGVTLGGVE